MSEFILSASILSADFACLADQIRQAEAAGADWFHIDVMDGHFVPNITMGPFIVESVRKMTTRPLDVHLMIEKPERYTEAFIRAGANYISVHIEDNPNIHRTLQAIRNMGAKAGIVLNPGTPASAISAVLPVVDFVLIMSVNPGYSGQTFLPEVLPKIIEIRTMIQNLQREVPIEIDGGINPETLRLAYSAGARIFVAATAIFKHPQGIKEGVKSLRESVK
jgi:ribulose-phosphate 3-epimerase